MILLVSLYVSHVQVNEIPRVCIANGMDTGTCPPCITDVLPTDDVTVSQDTNVNDVKAETQNTDDLVSENGSHHD